jgi:hypothetical protein
VDGFLRDSRNQNIVFHKPYSDFRRLCGARWWEAARLAAYLQGRRGRLRALVFGVNKVRFTEIAASRRSGVAIECCWFERNRFSGTLPRFLVQHIYRQRRLSAI